MQVSEHRVITEYDHAKSEWRVIIMEKDMDLGAYQVFDIMATQDDELVRGMAVKGLLRAMPDYFCVPDEPAPHFDAEAARDEGWDVLIDCEEEDGSDTAAHIFPVGPIFDTSTEAIRYVERRAAMGSYLHQQGLAYLAYLNAEIAAGRAPWAKKEKAA